MKRLIACLSVIVLLTSCTKSGSKKVFVLSEGSAAIDLDSRTIQTTGRGHEEKEVLFYDDGKVNLNVMSQAGNATISLPEDGIYILNTKRDTIIGASVNLIKPRTEVKQLSEDELRANIDSLQQIISGNVKAGKTFYILPNQAAKVTSNMDAIIVAPYHQMTRFEKVNGKDPEVYQFFPIKEARATLEKLKGFLGDEKAIND